MWEQFLMMEIGHLHKAAQLLEKYENKHYSQVIPDARFPEPLHLGSNIEYVRGVLGTVNVTAKHEHYTAVADLPPSADFFRYQNSVNPDAAIVPSHLVIEEYLKAFGEDYRYQTAPHPVAALESRDCDDTRVGRSPTETADAELLVRTLQNA